MTEIKDYPINVLESYEAIEDLLVSHKPNALYKKNSVKSDCLLMILNNLYETRPRLVPIDRENLKPETQLS